MVESNYSLYQFNMFRTISNFTKTWRLLKILSSKAPEDAEKILDSAVREANLLANKVDARAKETNELINKKISLIERKIQSTLANSERHIAFSNKSSDKNFQTIVNKIEQTDSKFIQQMGALFQSQNTTNDKIHAQLVDISSILSSLRDYSTRQSNDTLRWKDGYDYRVLKNFITRIIHSIDEIEFKIQLLTDSPNSNQLVNELEFIKDILVSNLDGEGLVRIEPFVGDEITTQTNRIVVKDITLTDDENKDSKIAKIINYGYELYLSDEETKLIRPALVDIYKKK